MPIHNRTNFNYLGRREDADGKIFLRCQPVTAYSAGYSAEITYSGSGWAAATLTDADSTAWIYLGFAEVTCTASHPAWFQIGGYIATANGFTSASMTLGAALWATSGALSTAGAETTGLPQEFGVVASQNDTAATYVTAILFPKRICHAT